MHKVHLLFQSTHPRRVWPLANLYAQGALTVSIHTPTQGVTLAGNAIGASSQFQSTHPRRVWPREAPAAIIPPSFNPHTHAGCDCSMLAARKDLRRFNPHTHAGCDLNNPNVPDNTTQVSIHTPTQGVTRTMRTTPTTKAFQSTHPRRVWLYI